jgi:hypothetical protein
MVDIAEVASPRVSTMTTSGDATLSRATRSSTTLTGIAPDRSSGPSGF